MGFNVLIKSFKSFRIIFFLFQRAIKGERLN